MIDIHPPHETVHTWKDFFIHIATIVVGLVIAVGLEQTVITIEHARQRRELIEGIHQESANNLKLLDNDLRYYHWNIQWEQKLIATLASAPRRNGRLTVIIPSRSSVPLMQLPSDAVWSIAHTHGTADLLPENLAEIYDRLDLEAAYFVEVVKQEGQTGTNLRAVATHLQSDLLPRETLDLSEEQADRLGAALAADSAADRDAGNWAVNWKGACLAVIANVTSRDGVTKYIIEARTREGTWFHASFDPPPATPAQPK